MNKKEFLGFTNYLKEIFPNAKIPTSKKGIEAWYEPYENITYEIAENMAKRYLAEETGNFNYAKLLKCKPKPRANAQAYQPAVSIFDEDK